LLDTKLKNILPPLVEAYLEYLRLGLQPREDHLNLQTAICIILYTLCKVRGYKVIVGFLSNEPRYLEMILRAVENTASDDGSVKSAWQVPYVLLLWLSHLLLTPFDLASISDPHFNLQGVDPPKNLPSSAARALRVGMMYLPSSTKAQDAAAAMLVRLMTRPDMQKLQLADVIVENTLSALHSSTSDVPSTIYERLGPLRLLAGVATSSDLGHLIPHIYRACEKLSGEDGDSNVATNAVARKLIVKIFRNVAILSLRPVPAEGPLLSFLETTSVLEDVIDHLLSSLSDRDTPVRYAAAKAISLIILELDPSMGHEVIKAILDTFKEDMPRRGSAFDFRTADPLKWHGLTLALAHALFKRTASPEQLPDIVNALVSALQFEQRTATGSSIGTNVRDAANFGVWSMARRYTSDELLAVQTESLRFNATTTGGGSVIAFLAVQLVLSACLDPAGNIRRGSSAALQELTGRHPNQVHEGIALVQVVEYQAVGLRRRAMIDVAGQAAVLHPMYHAALVDGLLGWRGLGSADVASREAAAQSLALLHIISQAECSVVEKVLTSVEHVTASEFETWHGAYLTLACIIEGDLKLSTQAPNAVMGDVVVRRRLYHLLERMLDYVANFSPRVLRSELPVACARLITSLSGAAMTSAGNGDDIPIEIMDTVTERLLAHREDSILQATPSMARALFALKRKKRLALGHIEVQKLSQKVRNDGSKSSLNGASRAMALGALAAMYAPGMDGQQAEAAVTTLAALVKATNVDWRTVGLRALQLALENASQDEPISHVIFQRICDTVLEGMRDYTIDERGDVGSLVRLQAISCASSIFRRRIQLPEIALQTLRAGVVRLSLEKLDRVRLQAARCRGGLEHAARDIAAVSSYEYFYNTLQPLGTDDVDPSVCTALLEGCISCAGGAAEPLLQASRAALVHTLGDLNDERLHTHLTTFATILKGSLTDAASTIQPALELLAFLLDMQIPQRLVQTTDFKWRNLLSTVQKSHHKSNDLPKILAAVHVYRGLADVEAVRGEVVKKLVSMVGTNPYPRVRVVVAETLWMVTRDEVLMATDWAEPTSRNARLVAELQAKYVAE